MMRLIFLWVSLVLFITSTGAQAPGIDTNLLKIPLQYTVLKTTEKIQIDGRDIEKAWDKAPWTEIFTDIATGEEKSPQNKTRCKMLWDDDFLYLYARLDETGIWASIKEHDKSVFQDNAFEMFIDIDGNTHNYYEFQINAFNTVWDLFMPKPYRNGGRGLTSWDIKDLKKAIHLDGTINDPSDTEKAWSIELAIPFKAVYMGRNQQAKTGSVWRMNFSRVEWDTDTTGGNYTRKKDQAGKLLAEHYLVWSPQGIVNLHYPERWGYIIFSDQLPTSGFLSKKNEALKLTLWKYYYLQQDFKNKYGKYAGTIGQLDSAYSEVPSKAAIQVKMEATDHQFWIQCIDPNTKLAVSVDEDGDFRQVK